MNKKDILLVLVLLLLFIFHLGIFSNTFNDEQWENNPDNKNRIIYISFRNIFNDENPKNN